ncbi:MAG: metallophosphoesterase [Clostridia bacterium]|nr:metallophosphoesterase [Clostridia bacterium]
MAQPVKFYIVTDTHFRPNSMCENNEAYREYMKYEQMCLAENEAILKATFAEIAKDNETNIVIMPGDLSKDGEKQSHIEFLKYLDALRQTGKKIYVITARHDFNSNATAFINGGRNPVEGTTKEELYDLYYEYGYSDAVAKHEGSMSYVAQIAPGIRMLALDSDGETDGEGKGSVSGDILAWAKQQAIEAKNTGNAMFVICHYPILPSSPFFELVRDARLENRDEVIETLADNGVNLAFTGHMHIQSANVVRTEKGNEFWDICTSALVGSPAAYRKVEFDGRTADIKTLKVPAFDWDMQDLSNDEYFDRQFECRIKNRIDRTLSGKKGFKGIAFALVKHIINTLTLGGIARLSWVRIDKSLKKVKFLDFACTIAINMFKGDEPFVEGTPEYEAVAKVVKRFSFIIKKVEPKLSKTKKLDLKQMVFDSIGNNKGFSDNDLTIKLK